MSDAGFGDIEPEDSWDPDDALPVAIDNLRRRLELLGQELDDREPHEYDLDDLDELLERARARRDLNPRDELRIRHTAEDLALLRSRAD